MTSGQAIARRILLTVCSLCLLAPPAAAQDYQDGQIWMQAVAISQISRAWRTHLELQPRLFEDGSELGVTVVRMAIGRQLTPRISLWGGYAWVPRTLGDGIHHENRLWQQLLWNLPRAGAWTPQLRVRLEQRWLLGQWGDSVHRLRVFARMQRQFSEESRWHVAFYDEVMVTLDTTTPGPFRGYDRNRVFGGVGRRFSPNVTADAGYLWENSTIRGPEQRNDHAAALILNINWPLQR